MKKFMLLDDYTEDYSFLSGISAQDATEYVTNLYSEILGRSPDEAGLNYWVARLVSGELVKQQVRESFEKSSEKYRKTISETEAKTVVTNIYRDELNRKPDTGGLNYWSNMYIKGMSADRIRQAIRQSSEYKRIHKSDDIQYIENEGLPPGIPDGQSQTGSPGAYPYVESSQPSYEYETDENGVPVKKAVFNPKMLILPVAGFILYKLFKK